VILDEDQNLLLPLLPLHLPHEHHYRPPLIMMSEIGSGRSRIRTITSSSLVDSSIVELLWKKEDHHDKPEN
jgi:hypothetical protein